MLFATFSYFCNLPASKELGRGKNLLYPVCYGSTMRRTETQLLLFYTLEAGLAAIISLSVWLIFWSHRHFNSAINCLVRELLVRDSVWRICSLLMYKLACVCF